MLFHMGAPIKLRGSVVAVSPSLAGCTLDHPLSRAWVREVPLGIVLWILLGFQDKAIRSVTTVLRQSRTSAFTRHGDLDASPEFIYPTTPDAASVEVNS